MNIQPITLLFSAFGVILGTMGVVFLAKASYRNALNEADRRLIKTLQGLVDASDKTNVRQQEQLSLQAAEIAKLQKLYHTSQTNSMEHMQILRRLDPHISTLLDRMEKMENHVYEKNTTQELLDNPEFSDERAQ